MRQNLQNKVRKIEKIRSTDPKTIGGTIRGSKKKLWPPTLTSLRSVERKNILTLCVITIIKSATI